MLKIIDTGVRDAQENMELDRAFLEDLGKETEPIIHLYDWKKPSITVGHFFPIETFFDEKKAEEVGVEIARRPTGGGATIHFTDYAFSLLIPSSHPWFYKQTVDSYKFVNGIVLEACEKIGGGFPSLDPYGEGSKAGSLEHFCMTKTTQYDVVLFGKKIAGGAQRRKRQGILHQGTIQLGPVRENLLREILKEPDNIVRVMQQYTHSLIENTKLLQQLRLEIRSTLIEAFTSYAKNSDYTNSSRILF